MRRHPVASEGRLRLRTDVNQTETLGIRFHGEDVRRPLPESPTEPEEVLEKSEKPPADRNS